LVDLSMIFLFFIVINQIVVWFLRVDYLKKPHENGAFFLHLIYCNNY